MKRFLVYTTVVAGAMFFHLPAYAVNTTPFSGTDAVTGNTAVSISGAGSFSDAIPTNNSVGGPFNLFTLNPDSTCDGPGCTTKKHGNMQIPDPLGTDTELLTVTFSGLGFQALGLAPFTMTGVYTARYSGPELGCAVGDGKSPSSGETDCFIWTGSSAPDWTGTVSVSEAIGNTGAVLALTLHNVTDWSITPFMTAQIIPAAVGAPEPYSIALLGFGLLGTLAFRRRQRR